MVIMVDGDTVFETDTVRELLQHLRDPDVGAVSGNTKVGNRRSMLGRWQHIEYVTGFNLDRRMYEVLQCTPTVPGAIYRQLMYLVIIESTVSALVGIRAQWKTIKRTGEVRVGMA